MSYTDFENEIHDTMISTITVSNSTSGNLTNQTLGTTIGGPCTGLGTFVTNNTGNLSFNPNDLLLANIANIPSPWIGINENTKSDLHVNGSATFTKDVEVDGDIKIKGKSLDSRLSKIEERLNILHINDKLESKWKKLRELGEQYRKLEEDLLLQERLWAELKR